MVLCFTKFLLDERHNLSKIWLAAHYEKKIKRNQVFEVDIERSVHDILSAEIFFDLKVSGHLLVGIVKIHSRKCKYLLTECNDVLYHVKLFRVGVIDLPDNMLIARANDITIPETFDKLDVIGNDMIDAIFSSNQSRVEDITLKETYENLNLLDETDMMDFQFNENAFDEDFIKNYDEEMAVFEGNNIYLSNLTKETNHHVTKHSRNNNLEGEKNGSGSSPVEVNNTPEVVGRVNNQIVPDQSFCLLNDSVVQSQMENAGDLPILLNQDMNNKLYLQPVKKVSAPKNQRKKKRKLTIDYIRAMSYDMIKKQLLDTSDIISAFELTPATKRLMVLKEIGRAENLFCLPAQNLLNPDLSNLYKRHLQTQKIDNNSLFSEDGSQEVFLNNPPKRFCMDNNQENVEENQIEISDIASLTEELDLSFNLQNDYAVSNDNLLHNSETNNLDMNIIRKKRKGFLKNESSFDKFTMSNTDDYNDEFQNTQFSKTSDERWEFTIQDKIIQLWQELKILFQCETSLHFSSVVKNKKKFQVAQRFLCLLMLKKLQIISLQQPQSFGDILIQPSGNFDAVSFSF